ncbi:MAG: hypothetical protein EHM21_08005, partial [Chloroflexi bacterium]
MDPSVEHLSFYAAPWLMTGAGELSHLFDPLPTGIADLCRVVQGLLIHPLINEWYGVDLTSTQKKEVNIRPVSEMLRLVNRLDPRPLSEPRPVDERVVGNCRDHAVLLCAMLRHQGRPARARAGFAAYLTEQMISNHWITEYWDAAQRRWVQVDPQIDDLQRKKLNITFATTDLPAGQFYTGAQAWTACRKGKAKSGKFGHNRKRRGWPFMRMVLLQEIASLNKVEVLAWDNWWELGIKQDDQVTAEERKFLDQIATAINADNFDEISTLFDDPRIGRPLFSKLQTLGLNLPAAGAGDAGQPSADGAPEGDPGPADDLAAPAAPSEGHTPLIKKTLLVSDLDRLAELAANAEGKSILDLPSSSEGHPGGNGYANGNGNGKNGTIDPDVIVVRGAQQHNLKHVNVTIPRNKLV